MIVNNFKNGELDCEEIEKTGKIKELKFFYEEDFEVFKNDSILKEMKNTINKGIKINFLLFTKYLAVISLKIKFDSSESDFEKILYLFEKFANSNEINKKILIKTGHIL